MAYINLDPAYFTNLKTIKLIARLGPGAEILPIKLWCHCAAHHAKDGALLNYDQAVLEALLGVKCVDALVEVGFLEKVENGYQCCNWLEHQGHLAAFKERAERGAKARWNKARMLKRGASNAKNDNKQCSKQSPVPYRTLPTSLNTTTTQNARAPDESDGNDFAPSFRATFLAAYPDAPNKRADLVDAERHWASLPMPQHDKAIAAVRVYAECVSRWPPEEKQFVPKPLKWLQDNGPEFEIRRDAWKRHSRGKNIDRKVSEKYVGDDSRY